MPIFMATVRFLLSIFLLASVATAGETAYFDTTILPILTRAGCNSGACHGAAAGRGGFRLSLWGSDPDTDYSTIVHDWEGRRIDRSIPANSLLLKKPSGLVDHEGGIRLSEESPDWQIVESWIRNGVNRSENLPLQRLAVSTEGTEIAEYQALALPVGASRSLQVQAYFAGGKVRDVTQLSTITIPDTSALKYEPSTGKLESIRPGLHVATLRYLDQVICIQVISPFEKSLIAHSIDQKDPGVISSLELTSFSLIDFEIDKRLRELNLSPAPLADELILLRRATLDLTGRMPTEVEIQSYNGDGRSDKYERLIDRLLTSPQFTQYWTYRWSRVFGVRPIAASPEGLKAFYQWLQSEIDNDTPWDEVAGKMLTAIGDSQAVGPAFFMLVSPDARGQAEQISKIFMGTQMGCANCHDHPLDRWKQHDYHGLAAIFARVQRERLIRWNERGFVTNPQTGQPAIPRLPGDNEISNNSDARAELTRWLFDTKHPYAARAFANRLWAHFFGRGLVEPLDDIRPTNPASHPELLNRLTEGLIHKQYSLKHFMREMVLSNAYRRMSIPVQERKTADSFYVYGPRKPLAPEVTLDLISDATGTATPFPDILLGTRAIAVPNPQVPSASLDALGRCAMPTSCSSDAARSSLAMVLHWINGDTLNQRIEDKNGTLNRAMESFPSDKKILEHLYLVTLNRSPSDREVSHWLEQGFEDNALDRKAFFEDLFWTLLTSNNFLENY